MQDKNRDLCGYRLSLANEKFPRELGKRLGRIKMMREESDYSDFFTVSREDAEAQTKTAEDTIRLVEDFLKESEN